MPSVKRNECMAQFFLSAFAFSNDTEKYPVFFSVPGIAKSIREAIFLGFGQVCRKIIFNINEVCTMKKGIHPNYGPATVTCACGKVWEIKSTRKEYKVGICADCHPFFTGKQKLVDIAGRGYDKKASE